MRFWNILIALCLILSAGLGLVVLAGGARGLLAPALQAELVVQDFPIPQGFGLDPERVAGFMADELGNRLKDDLAIRITLKADVLKKVREIVLPRLMNVVAVNSMMHDIPELSAILDIGAFKRTVQGTIRSAKDVQDVALTAPGALLAEVDGKKIKVITTSTGLQALTLGDMKAGESHQIIVWMDATSVGVDMGRNVKLGAADGQRGRVLLSGDQGWFGADVESLRWSRGLIGALLAGVLLFGLLSLMLPILTRRLRGS
jgi:hypothetical protein